MSRVDYAVMLCVGFAFAFLVYSGVENKPEHKGDAICWLAIVEVAFILMS